MTKTGDGAQPANDRAAHLKEFQKKQKAMREVLKEFGIDSEEELRAKLTSEGNILSAPVPDAPEIPVGQRDDLSWLHRGVEFVEMVANSSSIVVRPARPKYNPPMETIFLHKYATKRWGPSGIGPFVITHPDPQMRKNLEVMLSSWHHFRIDREFADYVYGDERWPCRTKTVIDSRAFKGWDSRSNLPVGERAEIEDPFNLRELVRLVLQMCPGAAWINWTRPWYAQFDIKPDHRIVNPYGNHLGNLQMRIQPVDPKHVPITA